MADDLARIVHIFDDSVSRFSYRKIDEVIEFDGMAPMQFYQGDVNFQAIHDHYGLSAGEGWNEKVDALRNPEVFKNYKGQDLEFGFVTDRDVIAARSDKIPRDSFFQLAAIGITRTLDDKIIVGIRGGDVTPDRIKKYASGLYVTPPAGSVSSKKVYDVDPISDTIVNEFYEEIGPNFNLVSQKPLGVFEAFTPGPTGVKVAFSIVTDANFADIRTVNKEANRVTNELKSSGANGEEIKNELLSRRLPTGGWEHDPLEPINNNPLAIRYFLESKADKQCGIGQGALMLYADWLERQ